jgi:hypothetical protein
MPMSQAEKLRKERMARNAAMLQTVVGAAHELASLVCTEQQGEEARRKKARSERNKRILEEARLAGPRKSCRVSSAVAREKIAAAVENEGACFKWIATCLLQCADLLIDLDMNIENTFGTHLLSGGMSRQRGTGFKRT